MADRGLSKSTDLLEVAMGVGDGHGPGVAAAHGATDVNFGLAKPRPEPG